MNFKGCFRVYPVIRSLKWAAKILGIFRRIFEPKSVWLLARITLESCKKTKRCRGRIFHQFECQRTARNSWNPVCDVSIVLQLSKDRNLLDRLPGRPTFPEFSDCAPAVRNLFGTLRTLETLLTLLASIDIETEKLNSSKKQGCLCPRIDPTHVAFSKYESGPRGECLTEEKSSQDTVRTNDFGLWKAKNTFWTFLNLCPLHTHRHHNNVPKCNLHQVCHYPYFIN